MVIPESNQSRVVDKSAFIEGIISPYKIIFLHDIASSPQQGWYPAISQKLQKLGIDHSIPEMPYGENAGSDGWLEVIDHEVQSSNKPIVLVGHKLGSRVALLYLEKHKPSNVESLFLISPPANNLETTSSLKFANLYTHKVDTSIVKRAIRRKPVIINLANDHDAIVAQTMELASGLATRIKTIPNRGQTNVDMSADEEAEEILNIVHHQLNLSQIPDNLENNNISFCIWGDENNKDTRKMEPHRQAIEIKGVEALLKIANLMPQFADVDVVVYDTTQHNNAYEEIWLATVTFSSFYTRRVSPTF